MKKIFTLIAAVLIAAGVSAQDNTFQFCDKDGNVIPDGSTITVTELVSDIEDEILSGLYVKCNSSSMVGLELNIENIDNGSFRSCFPFNCYDYKKAGNFDNGRSSMSEGIKSIESEWLPTAYGTCKVTFKLSNWEEGFPPFTQDTKKADCSSVTVLFKYADPAHIDSVKEGKTASNIVYNVAGQRVTDSPKGIIIVDGKKFIK